MKQVSGVLESLKVYKKRWGLAFIRLDDGQELRCTGTPLVGLKKGVAYQFNGIPRTHDIYGYQFDVASVVGGAKAAPNQSAVRKASRSYKPAYKKSSKRGRPARGRRTYAGAAKSTRPHFEPSYARVARPLSMPNNAQEAAVILWYEAAHHIGLDCRNIVPAGDRGAFIQMVSSKVLGNAAQRGEQLSELVALAAAEHAAKEIF